MEYGVGIATYRRGNFLPGVLDSLLDQTRPPDEVIVVDNGHEPEVNALVDAYQPLFEEIGADVAYKPGNPRTGLPGSRNEILDIVTSDVIAYVDDDVVCEPMWLEKIEEGYESFPEVVGVGGPTNPADKQLGRLTDTYFSTSTNMNRINEYGEVIENSAHWIPPEPIKTDLFTGANMSFLASELERIGGFDVDYSEGTPYFEEVDVMARFRNGGDQLLYHPDAMVNHLKARRGGIRAEEERIIHNYWLARNAVLFIKKNYPENYYRSLYRIVFGREGMPPELTTALRDVLKNDDRDGIETIRGYVRGIVST